MRQATYETGSRMLPVLHYRGKRYFVDERLREFRNTENPHEVIGFDTVEGFWFCLNAKLFSCPHCGQEAVRWRNQLQDQMACLRCGMQYTVTLGVNVSAVPPD